MKNRSHFTGFVQKRKRFSDTAESLPFLRKQMAGVEPVSPAWEAGVLPMNYICEILSYFTKQKEKFQVAVSENCRALVSLFCNLAIMILYNKSRSLKETALEEKNGGSE